MNFTKRFHAFYKRCAGSSRLISTIGLAILVCVGLASLWYEAKITGDILIAQHVKQLVLIFEKINKTCIILDFDHPNTHIDFLNVNSFEGSQVGAMNLAHPERWQGAYLNDNLTIHGRVYEIVKTKQGFFIVPGKGVVLASGLMMGRDIIINENSDVDSMIKPGGALTFKNKMLAQKMSFLNIKNQYNAINNVSEGE